MILLDYLSKDDPEKLKVVERRLEDSYKQVIASLHDRSVLPYIPTVYPVPVAVARTYKLSAGLTRLLFYSVTYPDAKDFNRFAIYITLEVVEKFPQHLQGLLGHEVAHVIATKGEVRITEEDIALFLKNRLGHLQKQEKAGHDAYVYFTTEMHKKIEEWNAFSMREEIEKEITTQVVRVSQEEFDKFIFGKRLDDYHRFIKVKVEKVWPGKSNHVI